MYKKAFHRSPSLRAELSKESGAKTIRGYAILFDVPAQIGEWREIIRKGAFDGVDLSNLLLLGYHRRDILLGKNGINMRIEIDETGLFFEAVLPDSFQAADIYELVKSEILDGMSFGFDALAWKDDIATKTTEITRFKRVYEISLTPMPAYSEAIVIAKQEPPVRLIY